MAKLTITLTLLLLLSCSSSVDFVSIVDMPKENWRNNQWADFVYNCQDTVNSKQISLIVRHTPDFSYDKLKLEITTISAEFRYWRDTVVIPLSSDNRKWLGSKTPTHYDLSTIYRTGVQFKRKGEYNIKIRYLFPADSLSGIKAIGITIENNGKE